MAVSEVNRWWVGIAGGIFVTAISTTVWGMTKLSEEEVVMHNMIEEHRKNEVHDKQPSKDSFDDLKEQVKLLNKQQIEANKEALENTKLLQRILGKLGEK